VLLTLMLFSGYSKINRFLVFFVTIPFAFIWAIWFGYDARNVALILPLIGMTAGLGLERIFYLIFSINFKYLMHQIVSFFKQIALKILSVRIAFVLALAVILIGLLPLRYTDGYLNQSSINKQKLMGYAELNTLLYQYNDNVGFDGSILTNYQMLAALPEINRFYRFGSIQTNDFMNSLNQPSVHYVLYCVDPVPTGNQAVLANYLETGKIKLLFVYNCWRLVTTCQGPCN
jgi:hypothetical protein